MTEASRRAVTRLDPRSPLVIDTHELGRRPGSMRRLSRALPAPADLGVDVLGVPEGTPLRLAVRLEAVMEGVLVTATADVTVAGECVRCLDPISRPLEASLQELYAYPDRSHSGLAGGRADHTSELPTLDGDLLDLEPALRDAVVLALPLQPVCRADCPGLCPDCGTRLIDDPHHRHESVDPRWAALRTLTGSALTSTETKES